MASCLGLYVEDNIIKYAKVSRSNDAIKVESFGVKFYDSLQTAIQQIVQETYSFKTPISINLLDEKYDKFEVFSLLSKNDIEGVVKTEFEHICYDKDLNPNAYEQRYTIANTKAQNEKMRIINVSSSKASIAQRKNQFSEYRVSNISPLGLAIKNIVKKEKNTISLVVNIENNTTITKIRNESVSDVFTISVGMKDIINNITQKENSYSKAYEICKNITMYTETDKDLQYEESEYLVDVMPTLFQIVSEVKKNIDQEIETIDKIYITGTAVVINNIDLYFQEYFRNITCELLKPSFLGNNLKVNIKDYMEVNSAISLALQGLERNNLINFTKEPISDKIFKALKTDISFKSVNVKNDDIANLINKFSRQYGIITYSLTLLLILYSTGSFIINKQLQDRIKLADTSIQNANNEINQINSYTNSFNDRINQYKTLIENIENINNENLEDKRFKETIPNLLNNIMVVIPKNVQLTSIQNTSGTHIVINATSNRYEQIAFFKTKLKTEGILKNVVSDTGKMSGGSLSVTIEGELP